MSDPVSKLYSMFVGPKGENLDLLRCVLLYGLDRYGRWRASYAADDRSLYPQKPDFEADKNELLHAVDVLLDRLETSIPFYHPRYAAQMLKDPALPAVLGYFLTMLTNPNNHAYEGGPPTTELELEVIEDLKDLIGYQTGWGHLTSGGSLANLEALWAVRDSCKPGRVLFPVSSHLSWKRICNILDIRQVTELPVDRNFRLDIDALERALKKNDVMMVMANFGTTGCGAIDPIADIVKLKEKYGFYLHVDAAYGGYFRSLLYDRNGEQRPEEQIEADLSPYRLEQMRALADADSVTIDPHKHGLMPYGAGSVLFRHERQRQAILNSAPYTYHVEDKPNIGTFSLEGSRPGAAAAGCWLVHRLFPLHRHGIGLLLRETLKTAESLYDKFDELTCINALTRPDLDILCFYHRDPEDSLLSLINDKTAEYYRYFSVENRDAPFFLSKFVIDRSTAGVLLDDVEIDADSFLTMRAVFIKHWMCLEGENSYVSELYDTLKHFKVK
jgi:glutamate/tyrosine decarboxylase-like PLP-dependent enzyme